MKKVKSLLLALIIIGLLGLVPATPAQTPSTPATTDISGTWIAKAPSRMGGEMEIVYQLKVADGKITGSQTLPFGDSPIIDGQVTGDTFHFTVALAAFGKTQNRDVTGKIVGDTLLLTPALPGPRPIPPGGGGPSTPPPTPGSSMAGPLPGSVDPPPAAIPASAPVPATSAQTAPVVARRGTPTPSYKAGPVDYTALPKISLPLLKDVPYNGLAKTPPMGWNSWNKLQITSTTKPSAASPTPWSLPACATLATSTSTSTMPGRARAMPGSPHPTRISRT